MNNSGKKTIFVDSNYFTPEDQNQIVDISGFSPSAMPDKIRFFSKNYFFYDKNNLQLSNKQNALLFIEKMNSKTAILKANKEKFSFETLVNGIRNKKFNSSAWLNFINSNIPDQNEVFEDYKIEFPELTNVSTIKDKQEASTAIINFEFIYSFFAKTFESLVSNPIFNTNTLPNIFNLIGDKKTDIRTDEENTILSLGGYVEPNFVDSLSLANNVSEQLKKYFEKYAQAYQKEETNIAKIVSLNLQSDIRLTKEKINFINKINFVPFPFFADVQLTNFASDNNSFIHKIENFGTFDEDFITYFLNSTAINNFVEKNYINDRGLETKIKFFDFSDFLRTNLGLLENSDSTARDISKSIKYSNLVNFINKNYNNKKREYYDLPNNSFIEPILYKIEKIETNVTQIPVQTFWISPNKENILRFIDTQIKYGNEYKYKIYVYFLIFGTKYSYTPYQYDSLEKIKDIENGEFKVNIEQKPVYKIGEFVISEINGGIYEAPYTKPSVKIFQQESDLRFVLDDYSQETFEEYEILETSEYKIFENIKNSQNNEDKQKIKFKKNINSFSDLQIYRTTTRPKNYLSFQGKLFKKITLKDNQKSFIDTVFPNQKYFYVFRYLNQHGIPSNPSVVYEIMLEEQEGFYTLKQNIIDFKKPPNRVLEKKMKKYLLIRPSIIQTQPNYKKDFTSIDDVDLGPDKEKVWQKPFIIKLTSNKTSKIVVFNVTPRIIRKK